MQGLSISRDKGIPFYQEVKGRAVSCPWSDKSLLKADEPQVGQIAWGCKK